MESPFRSVRSSPLSVTEPTAINVTFQNTGKTPARIIDSRSEPTPSWPRAHSPSRHPIPEVIVANQVGRSFLPVSPGGPIVRWHEDRYLRRHPVGEKTLYAYGYVAYLDIFNKSREPEVLRLLNVSRRCMECLSSTQ